MATPEVEFRFRGKIVVWENDGGDDVRRVKIPAVKVSHLHGLVPRHALSSRAAMILRGVGNTEPLIRGLLALQHDISAYTDHFDIDSAPESVQIVESPGGFMATVAFPLVVK